MIKLDPEDEADDDDQPMKSPLKVPMPNTSQAMSNDVTMNHTHVNNVQINIARVNHPVVIEPPQNFVSFDDFSKCLLKFQFLFPPQEKAISLNSIPKSSQKPAKTKTPSKKSSSASSKKKKRRKLSSSEEDESDYDDDDDY